MRGNRHNAPQTKNTREDPVKTHPRIRTEHLDLIPATVKILESVLHDHTGLARPAGCKGTSGMATRWNE